MADTHRSTQRRKIDKQPIARPDSLRTPALGCFFSRNFRGLRSQSGQQVLEYALMVMAISAALMGMYTYAKRGLQAMIRVSADQITTQRYSEQKSTIAREGLVTTDGNISTQTEDSSSFQSFNGSQRTDSESSSFSSGTTNRTSDVLDVGGSA